MRSPARIGLIVLALAIAVVGAGVVGMALLPAAVTEPVVKPVIQSIELLTGDDKPETITVDFDEQPAALGISNYPRIQLGARWRAQTWCKSVPRSVAASPDVTPS